MSFPAMYCLKIDDIFLYNGHVVQRHNKDRGVDAEPNRIMPPPRGAMGPARNRRRLNWPVPIAPRGGSAEVAQKFF